MGETVHQGVAVDVQDPGGLRDVHIIVQQNV